MRRNADTKSSPGGPVAAIVRTNSAMSWRQAIIVSLLALAVAAPATAGLYLLKSAAGLNLMTGPSPLHDVLYELAR